MVLDLMVQVTEEASDELLGEEGPSAPGKGLDFICSFMAQEEWACEIRAWAPLGFGCRCLCLGKTFWPGKVKILWQNCNQTINSSRAAVFYCFHELNSQMLLLSFGKIFLGSPSV